VETGRYASGRSFEEVSPFTGCFRPHPTSCPKVRHQTQQPGDGLILPDPLCLGLRHRMMGFRVATMVPMVGVIVLALGLLGVFHSIHEGNTIGRAVTVGRFLGMWVAMIFLWLRAARQDQPGVRPARPFAVTTGVAQVGWVTLLLAGTRRRAPDLHYCTGQGGTEF
jgi:low temperature requirement A protein (LtrA)